MTYATYHATTISELNKGLKLDGEKILYDRTNCRLCHGRNLYSTRKFAEAATFAIQGLNYDMAIILEWYEKNKVHETIKKEAIEPRQVWFPRDEQLLAETNPYDNSNINSMEKFFTALSIDEYVRKCVPRLVN